MTENAGAGQSHRPRPPTIALALAAAVVALELATLTSAYSYDGVAFAGYVARALGLGHYDSLYQSAHLLYGPLCYVWAVATGGASGWPLHLRLQVLNALLDGSAVAALYLVLQRVTSAGAALGSAIAVALSYSFWHYGSDLEVYILAAFTLALSLPPALRLVAEPGPRRGLVAGAWAGLAALGHLAHVVFGIATVVALLSRRREGRWRAAASFVAAAAAVTLTAFTAVLLGPLRSVRGAALRDFLYSYARPGEAGHHLHADLGSLGADAAAALRALLGVGPTPLALRLALVAGLATVVAAAVLHRESDEPRRVALRLAVAWQVAHLVFFSFWEPGNSEFWVAALVPGSLVLALGLDRLGARLGSVAFALPAVLLAITNYPLIAAERSPARNQPLSIVRALGDATPSDALIVVSGLEPWRELKIYVPYFAARRILILDLMLGPPGAGDPLGPLTARLAAESGPVYALSESVDRGDTRRRLEHAHGLAAGSLDTLLERGRAEPVGTLAAGMVLYRITSMNALTEKTAWPGPAGP